jgi:uncharacterized membrane protein
MKKYIDKIILIIFLLNSLYSKNLRCPNDILINVGLKSTKGLVLMSINEKKYESRLTEDEREDYEDKIDLKREFTSSISKVYDSFSPEKDGYWEGLDHITLLFFYISLIPIGFIFLYLILRFIFNKCSGPSKPEEITRFYRNSTWTLIVVSSIILFVLFTIILVLSVKVNNDVENTFDKASELINHNEKLYTQISETVDYFNKSKLSIPDEELMSSFKTNINKYVEVTKKHTDEIKDDDNKRNVGMILLYVYYLIMIICSFLFFFLKWKIPEGIIFFLFLLTLPAMLVFEGYNSKFFFYYADLCGSVNGALYKNEFPVAGQSLGYYYNCFDRQTKAELYGIRFTLYRSASEKLNENKEAINKYNTLNNEVLSSQLNCELVVEIVPKIEEEFCKDNLGRMYTIIELMSWLIFVTLFMALGVRRMENLIWKKKAEIESMIENLEQIY